MAYGKQKIIITIIVTYRVCVYERTRKNVRDAITDIRAYFLTVSNALGVLSRVFRTLNIVDQFRRTFYFSFHKSIFRAFFSPAAITTRLRFVDFRPFYYVDARARTIRTRRSRRYDVYISYDNRVRRTDEKIVFEYTPFFFPGHFFRSLKPH